MGDSRQGLSFLNIRRRKKNDVEKGRGEEKKKEKGIFSGRQVFIGHLWSSST
jgi:hypothetical protein